jgi:KUP system potassium uptake protein
VADPNAFGISDRSRRGQGEPCRTAAVAELVATIALVIGFRSSSHLAGAYGVAVAMTMIITTILAGVVARDRLHWSRFAAVAVTAGFLIADVSFLGANLFKIADGGWFPLLVGAFVFTLMTTWRRGRQILNSRFLEGALSPDLFVRSLRAHPPVRVPGTAVFMHRTSEVIPPALLHSLKHYKALHDQVILLTIFVEEVARLRDDERVKLEELGDGIYCVTGHYGYMEVPDVPGLLARVAEEHHLQIPEMDTTYFLGRETLIVTSRESGMATWREKIFASMMRNAESAARFFRLPPNRVVELGAQIEF